MLDIEVVGSVAPGANIAVYFAPNTDSGFLDGINQAVNDTVRKPSVISISWGGPESSWTAQSLQSYNSALQAAAAVGVTVCVACGDNGSDGRRKRRKRPRGLSFLQSVFVSVRRDEPNALAVHPYPAKSYGTIYPPVCATGGGVSATFALPTWQSGANVPPSEAAFNGRGLPDVSGDADPATGYSSGRWVELYRRRNQRRRTAVGGTARIVQPVAGKARRVPEPQPLPDVAGKAGTFRDITSGNNGDFKAAADGTRAPDGEVPTARVSCRR